MPLEDTDEEGSTSEEPSALDELFGPTTDDEPATETEPPAVEPAEEADPDSPDTPLPDDLFGRDEGLHGQEQGHPILGQPGGLASQTHRWWTDNTAKYRCEARMLVVHPQKVVLAKADGDNVAVPFSRLSDEDLQFVQAQVAAQEALLAQRAAIELLASLLSE